MSSKESSLLSIFLGIFIISQIAIYLLFIFFDKTYPTTQYVYGTEIVALLFCIFATYITWKSATVSESKALSLFIKFFIIIITIGTTTLVLTGIRAEKRIEKIKLFHLERILGKDAVEKYQETINNLNNLNNLNNTNNTNNTNINDTNTTKNINEPENVKDLIEKEVTKRVENQLINENELKNKLKKIAEENK